MKRIVLDSLSLHDLHSDQKDELSDPLSLKTYSNLVGTIHQITSLSIFAVDIFQDLGNLLEEVSQRTKALKVRLDEQCLLLSDVGRAIKRFETEPDLSGVNYRRKYFKDKTTSQTQMFVSKPNPFKIIVQYDRNEYLPELWRMKKLSQENVRFFYSKLLEAPKIKVGNLIPDETTISIESEEEKTVLTEPSERPSDAPQDEQELEHDEEPDDDPPDELDPRLTEVSQLTASSSKPRSSTYGKGKGIAQALGFIKGEESVNRTLPMQENDTPQTAQPRRESTRKSIMKSLRASISLFNPGFSATTPVNGMDKEETNSTTAAAGNGVIQSNVAKMKAPTTSVSRPTKQQKAPFDNTEEAAQNQSLSIENKSSPKPKPRKASTSNNDTSADSTTITNAREPAIDEEKKSPSRVSSRPKPQKDSSTTDLNANNITVDQENVVSKSSHLEDKTAKRRSSALTVKPFSATANTPTLEIQPLESNNSKSVSNKKHLSNNKALMRLLGDTSDTAVVHSLTNPNKSPVTKTNRDDSIVSSSSAPKLTGQVNSRLSNKKTVGADVVVSERESLFEEDEQVSTSPKQSSFAFKVKKRDSQIDQSPIKPTTSKARFSSNATSAISPRPGSAKKDAILGKDKKHDNEDKPSLQQTNEINKNETVKEDKNSIVVHAEFDDNNIPNKDKDETREQSYEEREDDKEEDSREAEDKVASLPTDSNVLPAELLEMLGDSKDRVDDLANGGNTRGSVLQSSYDQVFAQPPHIASRRQSYSIVGNYNNNNNNDSNVNTGHTPVQRLSTRRSIINFSQQHETHPTIAKPPPPPPANAIHRPPPPPARPGSRRASFLNNGTYNQTQEPVAVVQSQEHDEDRGNRRMSMRRSSVANRPSILMALGNYAAEEVPEPVAVNQRRSSVTVRKPAPPPPPLKKAAIGSAVLESIKSGLQLRRAEPVNKPVDTRMTLLNSIKTGNQNLRTVAQLPPGQKLLKARRNSAIVKILANRAKIAGDSDSSDSSSDSDDDFI